jgi:ABC-2 type transport system ATP-binding protein
MNSSFAIQTQGLTKKYGHHTVVDDLTISVPAGSVFAFLGTNGAGKTTTIKMLMDLLKRDRGSAELLGLDAVKDSLMIRQHVGYVGQNQKMYDWMKVDEIIWFCKGFYESWDDAFATQMKRHLGLPGDRRIGALSTGMQAKVALLLALAYHPDLLILDEPTAGLDVTVRRDFMEGIVHLIQEEARTVFFSTHMVHEVERMADRVGILDDGKLIWDSPIEDLKRSVKRITLTFDINPPKMMSVYGGLTRETEGRQTRIVVRGFSEKTMADVKSFNPTNIKVDDLPLEDIFVAMARKGEMY